MHSHGGSRLVVFTLAADVTADEDVSAVTYVGVVPDAFPSHEL